MNLLRKWNRASVGDLRLLARACGGVIAVRIALFVLPFHTVRRLVGHSEEAGTSSAGASSAEDRDRIIWAVNAASRRLLSRRPCLTKALAAQWMLGQAGHAAELCIGARKDADGRFAAHAWLEDEGVILIGGSRSAFTYERFVHTSRGDNAGAGNPQVDPS